MRSPQAFIADCMVGKLAKWLRILGCDTWYFHAVSNEILLQNVLETGRILLTRDTALFRRIPKGSGLFIESDHVEEQLKQVIEAVPLDLVHAEILTRCVRCNKRLQPVEKSEIEAQVPEFVYHTQTEFSRCRGCGKVYWKGSHQAHIIETLKRFME